MSLLVDGIPLLGDESETKIFVKIGHIFLLHRKIIIIITLSYENDQNESKKSKHKK